MELIQVMIQTFSESPPVYSKGRQDTTAQQSTPPYPTQS